MFGDEAADGVLDDPQQRLELGARPPQVVCGQQPEGDDLDAGFPAPLEQLEDLVGALLVAAGHVEQAHGPGPPAVAVAHHADVPGNHLRGQGTFEPARVEPVNQATKSHLATFLSPCSPIEKVSNDPELPANSGRKGWRWRKRAAGRSGRRHVCGGWAIDLRIEGSSPSNDARYSLRSRFIFPAMPA